MPQVEILRVARGSGFKDCGLNKGELMYCRYIFPVSNRTQLVDPLV